MRRKVAKRMVILAILIAGVGTTAVANESDKPGSVNPETQYANRVKFEKKDKVIRGANVDEVLSRNKTIRKARAMFSGYSVKDDVSVINAKFKRLNK